MISTADRAIRAALILLGAALVGACAGVGRQIEDRMGHACLGLSAGGLEAGGVGFLTPAAATGREADKQALALVFSEVLQTERPDIQVVPLPVILSAVNAAQLDQEYKKMYRDYLDTGILDGDLLGRLGEIGGVRYLVQLNLAAFDQGTRTRFSFFGLRFVDTKQGNMRVFAQVWDSRTGAVAWEGGGELNYAYETMGERPVTFPAVATAAARRMFEELPRDDRNG